MIWASCTCLQSTCATLVDPLWRTRLRARLKTERFWFDSRGWDERVTGRCIAQPTVIRKAGVRSRDTTKPAKCWSDTSVSHTEVAGAIPAADSICKHLTRNRSHVQDLEILLEQATFLSNEHFPLAPSITQIASPLKTILSPVPNRVVHRHRTTHTNRTKHA